MARATWNGTVLGESDSAFEVDGYTYFPAASLRQECFRPSASDKHSVCSWKGTASYYDIVVDGQVNRDAAWYYPEPSEAAMRVKNHVGFWRGVIIER